MHRPIDILDDPPNLSSRGAERVSEFPESPRSADGRRHRLGRQRRRSRYRAKRIPCEMIAVADAAVVASVIVVEVEGGGGLLRVVELHVEGDRDDDDDGDQLMRDRQVIDR